MTMIWPLFSGYFQASRLPWQIFVKSRKGHGDHVYADFAINLAEGFRKNIKPWIKSCLGGTSFV